MLRVRARLETKLRDGKKDALETNKRDLDDGMEGVRSALGVRRDSGGAWTARATTGEKKVVIGLPEGIESDSSKRLAEITATESAAVMGVTAGESEGIIGSSRLSESEFLGSLSSARRVARCVASAPARVCPCCVCCCCTRACFDPA